jgi:outer membrane lipoprotein-sorting protein
MKKITRLCLILLVLFGVTAFVSAQTLESVLAKTYEAQGGLDKLKSIQTTFMKAKMMMQGLELPITIYAKRPTFMRSEILIQGMKIIQVYDGAQGWMINPMMGSMDPIDMPSEEMKSIKEQADMDGFLVDWKTKGHVLELIGKEDVEGADAYHIKVTTKDTTVRHIYIDADSYLPIQQKGKYPSQGKEIEITTTMGNYKQVGDFVFPFSTEGKMEGKSFQQMLMDTIMVNVPLPDSLFARPKVEKKEKPKE